MQNLLRRLLGRGKHKDRLKRQPSASEEIREPAPECMTASGRCIHVPGVFWDLLSWCGLTRRYQRRPTPGRA